jgi:WhiB family transcriptional regulator, redox-sensing transcriptional regulator
MKQPARLANKTIPLAMPTPIKIEKAPCQSTDPETFFTDPTETEKIALAKSFCDQCQPVNKNPCLSFALTNKVKYGIWGGLTPDERQNLLRKQNRNKR